MFSTPAFAQTAGGDGSQLQTLMQYLPIALIMVVFYFLLIRPQQTRAKQLKTMQEGLRRGDRILTAGGIIGTVSRVINDSEVEVALNETVKVRVVRSTISSMLAKTEPAKGEGTAKTDVDADISETEAEKKRTSKS